MLGGFGTCGAFVVVMALDPVTLLVGGGWMVFGLALYFAYRRYRALPLTETVKVETLEPLGVEEIEYRERARRLRGRRRFSTEPIATAVRLAAKRRRGIHVVSLLTVPQSLPLTRR